MEQLNVNGLGYLLGEGEVELLDLPELVLQLQQALLARRRVGEQALPARDHVTVPLRDRGALLVPRRHQLLLQGRDVLDALVLERGETCVKDFLRS